MERQIRQENSRDIRCENRREIDPALLRKWVQREPMTLDELSECMGVTRQRIAAIEQSALRKIREYLTIEQSALRKIREYLTIEQSAPRKIREYLKKDKGAR